MFKLYPLVTRFTLLVALPLVLTVLALVFHFQSALTLTNAKLEVVGISGLVNISRDRHGVVSIETQDDNDVFFAMGYVHAQDRLWQLEVQRRISQGRLSEIFGLSSVNNDVWMRALGLRQSSEQAWATLSVPAQASLIAYAKGINAWLDSGQTLPLEFELLGIKPEPWSPLDSLAWAKVFALNLSNNMWREVEYLEASKVLNEKQMSSMFNHYPSDSPITVTNAERISDTSIDALLGIKQALETELHIGGKNVGSNAWVISSELSEQQLPILANDPHLGLQIPSLWYVVKQKGEKLNASGMSIVGLPLVIFGKNQHIAWGGTSMMADVQDLYIEQVNPDNPKQYLSNGEWQDFSTRTEVIKVKTAFPEILNKAVEPINIHIRSTNNGPIISDVVAGFEQPMALSWTALQAKDSTYESFFRLGYARNWSEFKAAVAHHVTPTLNMLYSDIDKNIGYIGVGKIPLRSKGEGQLPVPGWTGEYRWMDYIPVADMPQSFNPAKGYIVSANNKIVDENYPYFISYDWASPARAQRIEQLIEQKRQKGLRLSLQDMKAMQGDTQDYGATQLIGLTASLKGHTDAQQQALDYLHQWHGDMNYGSQAATIFTVWMSQLRQHLFLDELTGEWNKKAQGQRMTSVGLNSSDVQIFEALRGGDIDWCDNVSSVDIKESCEEVMLNALTDAIEQLEMIQGSDMDDWHWGKAHHTVYQHQPFSQIKLLASIFERRIGNGGSPNSINVADVIYQRAKGYEQYFGAGFRQVMQLSKTNSVHFYMNSTGQSGHVMSPNYDDMVVPFNAVEFYNLDEPQSSAPSGLLTLRPLTSKLQPSSLELNK